MNILKSKLANNTFLERRRVFIEHSSMDVSHFDTLLDAQQESLLGSGGLKKQLDYDYKDPENDDPNKLESNLEAKKDNLSPEFLGSVRDKLASENARLYNGAKEYEQTAENYNQREKNALLGKPTEKEPSVLADSGGENRNTYDKPQKKELPLMAESGIKKLKKKTIVSRGSKHEHEFARPGLLNNQQEQDMYYETAKVDTEASLKGNVASIDYDDPNQQA